MDVLDQKKVVMYSKVLYALCLLLLNCGSMKSENTKESFSNEQNLLSLVRNNKLEEVKVALNSGSNVDTQDEQGKSLLLLATLYEYYDMAELLVAHGADVNKQDRQQDSPFLLAGAKGQTDFVKLYLENGARFDVFNRYYGSALIPACERGHVETVKVLTQVKDFPIDHINNLGWTALLEAVILGDGSEKYQEIVKILKENGADLSIGDKNKVTALEHAEKMKQKEIVKILSE